METQQERIKAIDAMMKQRDRAWAERDTLASVVREFVSAHDTSNYGLLAVALIKAHALLAQLDAKL